MLVRLVEAVSLVKSFHSKQIYLLTMSEQDRTAYLILLGLFILYCVNGLSSTEDERKKHPKQFDFLVFAQHWPPTVCFAWKEGDSTHECMLPEDEEWSIHGVWPSDFHGMGPTFCNTSNHFNPKDLESLESDLKKKWMDIQNLTDHYQFWRHEWDKHGTCAASLEIMDTEFKYFQQGLKLLDTYDMKHVLAKANIMPGQSYLVEDIINAIEKVLGYKGKVSCVKNDKKHESYLFQINVCLNKTLELIDCNISGHETNCNQSEPILYPSITPPSYSAIQV